MKFKSEFKHFHSRKCIWKCCLRNGVHLSRPQCVKPVNQQSWHWKRNIPVIDIHLSKYILTRATSNPLYVQDWNNLIKLRSNIIMTVDSIAPIVNEPPAAMELKMQYLGYYNTYKSQWKFTTTTGKPWCVKDRILCAKLCQYYDCRCPGSSHDQDSNSHGNENCNIQITNIHISQCKLTKSYYRQAMMCARQNTQCKIRQISTLSMPWFLPWSGHQAVTVLKTAISVSSIHISANANWPKATTGEPWCVQGRVLQNTINRTCEDYI